MGYPGGKINMAAVSVKRSIHPRDITEGIRALMNSSSISIILKAKFLPFPLRAIAADVMTNT